MAVSVSTRQRISKGTELLMGAVAWGVYAANFLVNVIGDWFGVGEVVSLLFMAMAYVGFAFWFGTHGVSVIKGTMLREFMGKALIGIIPIVNVFAFSKTENGLIEPNIRAMVRKVIEITRKEDAEYNQEQAAKVARRQPQNAIRYKR